MTENPEPNSRQRIVSDVPLGDMEHEREVAEFAARLHKQHEPLTIEEVHYTYSKWLELDGDYDYLDVTLAARCDLGLPGDHVWLFVVAPSGTTKTEMVRSLEGEDVYTLDSLTSHTIVSGKISLDEEGRLGQVRGILNQIDGKCLIIKDFTVILSKREEERSEIFSQLRALHDGYLEFAYGTTKEPIRVHAEIGLVAATTPAVDMYGKLAGLLGERFLKIRHVARPKETAQRAAANLGRETEMREELKEAARRFIDNIQFHDVQETKEQRDFIICLACATAILRTPVMVKFWRFEENEGSTPNIECPTRLTKQFLKLAKLLANIRGHNFIMLEELKTLQRVARDTCVPNRIRIIKLMLKEKRQCTTRQIADGSNLVLATCWRELKELEYLGIVYYEQVEESTGIYGTLKHRPEKDGWALNESTDFSILFHDISLLECVSQTTKRVCKSKSIEEEERYIPVVCETDKAQYPLVVIETLQIKPPSLQPSIEERTCGQCTLWHKPGCSHPDADPSCVVPLNRYAIDCRDFMPRGGT